MRRRDAARLSRLLAGVGPRERPPAFVVALPRTLGWLEPCLKLVPSEVPVVLVCNGVAGGELERIGARFPRLPTLSLSVLPGSWVRHGTVLDILVAACSEDFFILDHDCYPFDPTLFEAIDWKPDEFLAGVDAPGFFTTNEATGLRYPRTHFLGVRSRRLLELRDRYGVGCEKAVRTPDRLAPLLAGIGIGDHNFPPARMAFYDTLQLAMSVGFALGWKARQLSVADRGISHVGGTARWMNRPGQSREGGPSGGRAL